MSTSSYVHLRVHSEYSIRDSIIPIPELIQKLQAQKVKSCALTDQMNLFGAVKFYQACERAGIKPIIGADVWVNNPAQLNNPYQMVMLCQNLEGYQNLIQLISRAYLEGQQGEFPCIEKTWLNNNTTGLLAIADFKNSDLVHAIQQHEKDNIDNCLREWQALFPGRFYLEIQRSGKRDDEKLVLNILKFALEKKIPVVATNNVRFLEKEDFEAHEARVCIHDGVVLNDAKRPKLTTTEQYLKSPQEMQTLFGDVPQVLENTVEIAKRCNLELELDKVFLPNFPVPAHLNAEQYLSQLALEGLKERLPKAYEQPDYSQRLERELSVINQMGFAGYFLIVSDFIRWAKSQRIPVGPGRGSGAGSLVAYVLRITDIDPMPYDLLFERFLNPERVSMPDFDIDFCMDNRDKVIEYVAQKYGRESVSQIITFGSMAAKAVVRDVGRVLGHPYGFVDKIAKLIPFELGITLDKALKEEGDLKARYEKEEEVKILIDLGRKLEGLVRNAGKHAGGVVIAPSKLTDFTPLYCEAGETQLVSQFDKDDVEKVGLVKFDFLGLRTLTIIGWTVDRINKINQKNNNDEPHLDIHDIPLEDQKTFELIKSCHTTAVFQLESRGMKDLVKKLQPECFEDIVPLVALFRPGPLQSGMVDDFINRKQGSAKIHYPHALLEPVLKDTYGIILYQEQVAKIAQVLSGYTLGQADLLRRAMGKKKPEEMAKQRAVFLAGAEKNKIDKKLAKDIFDLMEKFAGYGFNKSHSVAYALITYQTAYLKSHYPEEFMASVLSSDMDKTDKVVNFLMETRRMGITVLPPDINESHYEFMVTPEKKIHYGLGAIKGAGKAAIDIILEERANQGNFKSYRDFFKRIDSRKVNKKILEALIKSGAFDGFQLTRATMLLHLEEWLQNSHKISVQQQDLFGDDFEESDEIKNIPEWPMSQKLSSEKEVLGFYLSGHPLEMHQHEFKSFSNDVLTMGIVSSVKTMQTRRGGRMAFVKLECLGNRLIELVVFSDLYEKHKPDLVKDSLLLIEGDIESDDFSGGEKLLAKNIYTLDGFRQKYAKALLLTLEGLDNNEKSDRLKTILSGFKDGNCPVMIDILQEGVHSRFSLGHEWKIVLCEDLLRQLRLNFEASQFSVIY